MCHFISWTEIKQETPSDSPFYDRKRGVKLYYITGDCLKDSRGVELRKHLGDKFDEDVVGHGAIDFYWGLNEKGKRVDFTNFSSPEGLPDKIRKDLLSGAFRGMPITSSIPAMNSTLCDAALEKCNEVCDDAFEERNRICATACNFTISEADSWKKYERVCDAALRRYNRICTTTFWKLFLKKKNRIKEWK
jgi:hypothetical protein